MKIPGTKLHKAIIYLVLPACLILAIFLVVYPTSFTGVGSKKAIGKAERFAEGIDPQGMVVDKDGRLFVQSARNSDIYLVYKDGDVVDYTYINGYFGNGMDLDKNDNFILAAGHQVVVLNSSGKVIRTIDGFRHAYDVARGPDDLIFVSDSEANVIYCISPDNKVTIFEEMRGEKSDSVSNVTGISFDKGYENLYAVNMYKGDLYKISLSRENKAQHTNIIASKLLKPNFIDMDEQGNAYITCIGDNTIVRVSKNSIKELVDTKDKLQSPSGISVISVSDYSIVYVGSKDDNCIYKISIESNNQTKK